MTSRHNDHHDHAGHGHDDHAGHDHAAHGHDDHAGHDHAAHGHDDHAGHDHAAHGHDDHAGHDHAAHGHDDHAGHDHAAHGHDDHAGHDHAAHGHDDHAAHGHDDHAGHDHAAHAGHGHDDHSGHDHHDHSHDFRDASRRSLIISLSLIGSYMVAEVVGGILSGSLALLADAAHMLTDAGAIALALLAHWLSNRPATIERTFGFHRTEVLAAMINALSLWLITGWIFFEAYHRFTIEGVDVDGLPMLIVGSVGLLVNIVAAWVLHGASSHSLNVEGAFWHVMADLLGSVGVVISGVLVWAFNWDIVDPIASVIIGVLVLLSSWRLTLRVFKVLLDETPAHLDLYALCHAIEDTPGVTLVHDVHAWTVTSGYDVFTAHVLIDSEHPAARSGFDAIRARLLRIIHEDYGISHSTLQMESSLAGCIETHHVGHLEASSRAEAVAR